MGLCLYGGALNVYKTSGSLHAMYRKISLNFKILNMRPCFSGWKNDLTPDIFKQRFKGYQHFVMQGIDEETEKFHGKGNMGAIFGDDDFKEWVYEELLPELEAEGKSRVIQPNLTMELVTDSVAAHYKSSADDIRKIIRGPQQGNEARKVAMYLCQELSGAKLREIADHFNLHHGGSVSYINHQVRKMKKDDKRFKRNIDSLIKSLLKQET